MQSGSISPFCNMSSLYVDDSNYENEMHFKINQYLKECPLEDDEDEISIKCDNEEQFNSILDSLFRCGDGKLKMSGVTNNPMEIIVERADNKYRQFNEDFLMDNVEKGEN